MPSYLGQPDYQHGTAPTLGILIANLGTPDAPTIPAVRRYLAEFFADPRVFEFPRLLWWALSNLVILNVRPRRSAKLYAQIWEEAGSPLLTISQGQRATLEAMLREQYGDQVKVALGMRYGNPSIFAALEELRRANARRLLILPLYPQYSASTTGSTFDAVADTLKRWRWLPDVRFVSHYHDHPTYIAALVESIRRHWAEHGQAEKLLMSFHGLPKRYLMAGDPYYCEAQKTARLVAEALRLPKERYAVTFQSRFGREEWLQPYTAETLAEWGKNGVRSVDVICPGFAADCLETIEEIVVENRHVFMAAGGQMYRYIPALNTDPLHIAALAAVIGENLAGWLPTQAIPVLDQRPAYARIES